MKEITIKTPTQVIAGVAGKISKPAKCTFVSAMLAGLAAHLYQYTNKMYNYDDLFTNPEGYGTGAESARWFLQFMGEWMNDFLGNYSLPLVNGLFTLVMLALSAMLVSQLFEVKDMLLAAFVGIFFVTIPTVTCMNFFMYTVAYYSIGLLFSVLAGYLMVRHRKSILLQIAAVLLLACSLGTYQAYFPNTVCILVLHIVLISAFSGDEYSVAEIVKTAVQYVAELVLSLGAYFVFNKISLAYWNVELGTYQGINDMGQIELLAIPQMMVKCYYSFIWFCKNDIVNENPTGVVKMGILVMYAVSAVLVLYVLLCRKRPVGKNILFLLALTAYPVAVFLIYIMVSKGWVYTLMTFSVVFIYVFIFVWLDRSRNEIKELCTKSWGQLMHWGVSLAAGIVALVYVWYANGNYMVLQYTQWHDIAYFETLATQIKSADGYEDGLPLAVIGDEFQDSAHTTGGLMDAEFDLPGKLSSNINAYSRWQILIKYVGFNPEFLWSAEVAEVETWEEVQEMPVYPADGSIQIINDVIVLKLAETQE